MNGAFPGGRPASTGRCTHGEGTGRQDFMSRSQPTILVVEDEVELRQLIAERLEADGMEVAQADTGADAIERLRGFVYDGIVVDLRLPDANGMDILEEALDRFPGMHAVVITGVGG